MQEVGTRQRAKSSGTEGVQGRRTKDSQETSGRAEVHQMKWLQYNLPVKPGVKTGMKNLTQPNIAFQVIKEITIV